MKKPHKNDFIEYMEFDGKEYQSINEYAYRHELNTWKVWKQHQEKHTH